MRSLNPETASAMRKPTPGMGLLLYAGYLAIFFTTWAINGVDYLRIGESTETTRLWYALPTLFGCAFLVVASFVIFISVSTELLTTIMYPARRKELYAKQD